MLKPQVTGDPVSAVPLVKRDEATVDPDRPFRVPMRSGS
jgi:hypothetical protein